MTDRGVIYIASQGLEFLCEAIASAESFKAKAPEVSITLLTDIPSLLAMVIPPFDAVLPIDAAEPDGSAGQSWAKGLYVRVAALAQTPYEKTLFLDTDTRIRSADVRRVFDILDDYSIAMVPCTPANSRNCQLFGPMFNAGVIAYRSDADVRRLLHDWEALQRFHLRLASLEPTGHVPADQAPYLAQFTPAEKWFLLINDQTSLARLLSPTQNEYGVSVKVLDDCWNARGLPRHRLSGVIVDHANRHKVEPHQVKTFLAARRCALEAVVRG